MVDQADTEVLTCAGSIGGPERLFHIDVPSGATLTIGMLANTFDSVHELRWGGQCPGENAAHCTDNPDTATHVWINDNSVAQRAYFMIESAGILGDFTLNWDLAAAPVAQAQARPGSHPDYSWSSATVLDVTTLPTPVSPILDGCDLTAGLTSAVSPYEIDACANADGYAVCDAICTETAACVAFNLQASMTRCSLIGALRACSSILD